MTPDEFEPKGNQTEVLEAEFDETKIEAVAGSGKTTTMVARLKKEIEEGNTPPQRLLVLTFATEASHTIQEKLREELSPDQAFEVDVYNYHSFCYQLLQEYAYPLGLSPDFELVTEEKRSQILKSVYSEVDFTFVEPGSPASGGTGRETLREFERFVERMRRETIRPDAVRDYLPDDDLLRDLLGLVENLERAAATQINTDHPANADLMWDDAAMADGCDSLQRVYAAQASQYESRGAVGQHVADHLEAMAEMAESMARHLRTQDLDWQDFRAPEALFQGQANTLKGVKQTPFGRLREYVQMLRRARAYLGGYDAYIEELDQRGALDYDDLIQEAAELLQDDRFRDDIVSQWDLVFCDEFQDTDEAQLQLVRELQDAMQIMVIGDSDQAIHEWRGQDPENMSKLPDSFEEINLPLNFRSHQPILDMTNHLDRETQPIEAHRDDDPPNVFKVDSEREQTERQVSTTVSHLLTGRFADIPDRELGDIAILVRRNHQAQKIGNELDRESIPFSVSSSIKNEVTQGVETVLAYLRVLVNPGDDVSWQRLLWLIYRVPEPDIDTVLDHGGTIPEGYAAVSEDMLVAPGRLTQAMEDYQELRRISATHSVSELYTRLKQTTKIEWFLKEEDREALENIDQLISAFNDSPIDSRLTQPLVDYLVRQATVLSENTETATAQGSESTDAVDIMTVHQAKGLDFDTVLLPFLTEDEFGKLTLDDYQQKIYEYDVLIDSLAGEITEPLRSDLSEDQIAEEWRVLHVALTRAKNRLFLFGNSIQPDRYDVPYLDRHLPGSGSATPIDWSTEGPTMKIWDALMDSYDQIKENEPDAVRDVTDQVNQGVHEDAGNITYYGNSVSTDEAIDQLLNAADRVVAGTLADADTDTSEFVGSPLGGDLSVSLARQHSHSALEDLLNCHRKHYLDYVVHAYPDPQSTTPGSEGASHRLIGSLFHEVAELAYWRDYNDLSQWKAATEWLADADEMGAVVESVKQCIESYFETDAATWEQVGAEVPVDLEVPGVTGKVTGYMDSVRRHPDGGLVVLDYKTGQSQGSLEESQQLMLYVKAAQERFSEPIKAAGYIYVGEAGPDLDIFQAAELDEHWDIVVSRLQAADSSSFGGDMPGDHCRYCEHRSLGCPGDEFAYEDIFQVAGE